jgi:cytochrome bd-type quinol oxidase subunit 2
MEIGSMQYTEEQVRQYRKIFERRRSIRIAILVLVISLFLAVFILGFFSRDLFGIPTMTWAPFFYLVIFGLIILIAVMWKCPACNGRLGNPFNTRYCPRCGMQFHD